MTEKQVQELLETVKNLTAENKNLADENVRLKQKLEGMNELLLGAQRARFGQSSENAATPCQAANKHVFSTRRNRIRKQRSLRRKRWLRPMSGRKSVQTRSLQRIFR